MIQMCNETPSRIDSTDRGVSPVIGVVLMIAVTVILTGVIATFVFSFGAEAKAPPQATLSMEQTDEGIEISHLSGEAIDLEDLYLRGAASNVAIDDEQVDGKEVLHGGETVNVTFSVGDLEAGDRVTLVWDVGSEASILADLIWED